MLNKIGILERNDRPSVKKRRRIREIAEIQVTGHDKNVLPNCRYLPECQKEHYGNDAGTLSGCELRRINMVDITVFGSLGQVVTVIIMRMWCRSGLPMATSVSGAVEMRMYFLTSNSDENTMAVTTTGITAIMVYVSPPAYIQDVNGKYHR